MIHFIHGLFGTKNIWEPYTELGEHRLYSPDKFLRAEIQPEDTVIGYSLGGRVALRVADKINFQFKKLILLSSHPGLALEERAKRKIWEDDILNKMDTLTREEFMKFWNCLDVFSSSSIQRIIEEEEFNKNRKLFDQFRLSEQEDYLPLLRSHQDKVHYVYGKSDTKYKMIAERIQREGLQTSIINADHRVYLKTSELYPLLREII